MTIKRMTSIFVVVLATAALVVSGASAGKPKPYQGVAGSTQAAVQKGATKPGVIQATKSSGTLPFTGLGLGLFAAGGAAVVLAGYSLNRASRKRA